MNKLYKYILSIIFGIILYIDNIINTFSIGIPPKRPPHLCAAYVDLDDDGYHTANSLEEYAVEPPEVHGYIFQVPDEDGHPGDWHFEISDILPPDHMHGTIMYTIQIPDNIASLEYLDPNVDYGNGSINEIFSITLTDHIINMNYIE